MRSSGESLAHIRRSDLLKLALSIVAIGGAVLQLPATPVFAQEPAPSTGTTATALLTRVAHATDTPYRALQMVAYYGQPQSNALLDVRSTSSGRYVRAESGNNVTRLWSDAEETAPPLVQIDPRNVLEKYDVVLGAAEKLLGAQLTTLTFTRRSDGAMSERWWVHDKSGVVYRRDLYDLSGKTVGMSTVIEMEWGDPGPGEPVGADLDRAELVRTTIVPDAPQRLSGGYDLWRSYELEVDGRPAEQWVYSDGLHALSVFSTDGGLKAPDAFTAIDLDGKRAFSGPGPGTWAWEGAGKSWLVIAEEPAIDAAELIEPFPRSGPTFWARLGSVWSRLIGAIGGLFS